MWKFLKNIFGLGKPVHEYDAYGVTSKVDRPVVVPFGKATPVTDSPPIVADIERAYGDGLTKSTTKKELPKALKPKINKKTGKAMPVRGKGGKFQKTNA